MMFVVLLFNSCNQTVIDEREGYQSHDVAAMIAIPDTTLSISPLKASQIAERYMNIFSKTTRGKRSIEKIETCVDSVGQPLFYVINFQNDGGYVCVAAHKSLPPVLAYSETGRISVDVDNFAVAELIRNMSNQLRISNLDEGQSLPYLPDWMELVGNHRKYQKTRYKL